MQLGNIKFIFRVCIVEENNWTELISIGHVSVLIVLMTRFCWDPLDFTFKNGRYFTVNGDVKSVRRHACIQQDPFHTSEYQIARGIHSYLGVAKLYRFNRFSSLVFSLPHPSGAFECLLTKKQEKGGTHKTRKHQQTRLVLTWITPRVWTQLPACLSHSHSSFIPARVNQTRVVQRLSGRRGVGSLAN